MIFAISVLIIDDGIANDGVENLRRVLLKVQLNQIKLLIIYNSGNILVENIWVSVDTFQVI